MRTVGVRLMADIADYQAKFRQAGATAKTLGGELDRASKAGKLDHATQQATGLGVGLLGAAAVAVKFSMDFDKQMSSVQAATHATSGEMGQLRQAAMDAGADTKFSATEAAKGIEELSKAGVSTKDVLGGGLKGALDLAAAGELDVGEAAETAASAMTQFKLSGKDVPHIADLLAAGAGKAQGSVHDMGMALNQSGLVASQMGLSIEETTGTLAAFAHAGLIGSDAGTSLKTALLMLANPTGKSSDLMQELGINVYDAGGKFVGMAGLADQLKSKLGGLTEQQRNSALATIFGSDAIRAASVLYEQGGAGVQEWTTAVNDTGYASETARIKTDNLAGDVERLKGSFETLAIQAGSGTNSALRTLVKTVDGAVGVFSDLPPQLQQAGVGLAAVSGATLLAGTGFLKARKMSHDFMDELSNMGPRGTAAAQGLGRIAGVAGRLSLVGVAVGAVFEGFQLFGDWVDKKHAPVKANIDKLTDSIKDFAATGQATGELAAKYGNNLQAIGQDVSSLTKGMADLKQAQADYAAGLSAAEGTENWNPIDPRATQRVQDLDKALTQLVGAGGASQARIFLQELAGSGKLTAAQFDQLTAMLPNYTEAAKSATTANSGMAKGFGSVQANTKTMTSALDMAIEAGQTLTDVWNQLNGAVLGSDKAMLAALDAIDAVEQSFKDNKRAVEGNTTAALKNRIAVGNAAEAAAKAAQAKLEETGSVAKANKVYQDYIGQLRKALSQAGLTKGQVDKLTTSYARMPSSVATRISTPGLPGSDKAIKEYDKKIDGLARKVNTTVSVSGKAKAEKELASLLIQRDAAQKGISVAEARRLYNKQNVHAATGGHIRGPGTDTSDSIDARLSDYEYVVRSRSVRKLGVRALDYINEYGELPPAYARGGLVNMRFPVDITKMKIPSMADVMAGVIPSGGRTSDFIVRVVRAAFPGLAVLSKDRPGARTLSGNVSYHSLGRAVDFSPSRPLAEWWNLHYKSRTKEFISPWNDLNIWNGQRHTYTGAIYRQHNFAGGNAHDHIAMAGGGVVREPVVGVGASGRTYSFGEYGPETVTPGIITRGAAAGRGGGGITIVIQGTHNGPIGSRIELDNWYVGMADRLKSRLR